MPQFDIATYSSQIFWLIVCFGLTFFGISQLILPRYKKILEQRIDHLEDKIKATVCLQKEIVKLKMVRMQQLDKIQAETQQHIKEAENKILVEQKLFAQELCTGYDEKIRKLNDSMKNQRTFLLENLDSFIDECCDELMEKYFADYKHG
jgi:F-type H+-transporting ATPase subunit b